MVDGFWDGMNWATKYDNAETCRLSLAALMDDFHFMYKNHTTTIGMEERFFNVTNVVSNNYAETFYQCFVLMQQIHQQAVANDAKFVDANDKFTSFLFNLLAKSIVVREYSFDLLDASAAGDWAAYTKAMAGILESMIYFDSSAAALDPTSDPDSPYYLDASGNLMLKEHVDNFIQNSQVFKGVFDMAAQVWKNHLDTFPLQDGNGTQSERKVQATAEYEFTFFSAIQVFFGIIDGALNALPVGDDLYYCG